MILRRAHRTVRNERSRDPRMNRSCHSVGHLEAGEVSVLEHADGVGLPDHLPALDLERGQATSECNGGRAILVASDVRDDAAQALHHLLAVDLPHIKIGIVEMLAHLGDAPEMFFR